MEQFNLKQYDPLGLIGFDASILFDGDLEGGGIKNLDLTDRKLLSLRREFIELETLEELFMEPAFRTTAGCVQVAVAGKHSNQRKQSTGYGYHETEGLESRNDYRIRKSSQGDSRAPLWLSGFSGAEFIARASYSKDLRADS